MVENVYPEDSGVITILKAIFLPIWNGLDNCHVPGFDFSFADLFIAMLTAGLVGLIMKTGFNYFGSHFTDGSIKGGSGDKPKRQRKSKGD